MQMPAALMQPKGQGPTMELRRRHCAAEVRTWPITQRCNTAGVIGSPIHHQVVTSLFSRKLLPCYKAFFPFLGGGPALLATVP